MAKPLRSSNLPRKIAQPKLAVGALKRFTSTKNLASEDIEKKKPRLDGQDENVPMPSTCRVGKSHRNIRRSVSMVNLHKGKLANVAPVRPIRVAPSVVKKEKENLSTTKASSTITSTTTATAVKPRKRAAWDIKGKLADLEIEFAALKNENLILKSELQAACVDKEEIIGPFEELKKRFEETRTRYSILEAKNIEDLKKLSEFETKSYLAEKKIMEQESIFTTLQEQMTKMKTNIEMKINQLKEIEEKYETTSHLLKTTLDEKQNLCEENQNLKETLSIRDKELIEGENLRRRMHNLIQDLKGNIRVFCRVRPMPKQSDYLACGCISFPDPDNKSVVLNGTARQSTFNESASSKTLSHTFNFDHVFSPETKQNEVFEEIAQLIQSVLDGYNVCVFAYGATGSGKTYTMTGYESPTDESNPHLGMIPRAVDQIFTCIENLERKGWQYEILASFVEIYNEKIRDLLCNHSNKKYEIKFTKDNEAYVTNAVSAPVTDAEEILELIRTANKNRAVAATKCNDRSSRSHSVFILRVTGTNEQSNESCRATLNLIDLAGSERIKTSGSEGDRLKEAQSINRSLSNLGNVITALANKAEHIPFRNSKLTYLLSPCLSGSSKTLMFVNVSPTDENYQESLNSLRFATMVNECQVGVAQKKKN